MSTDLGLDDEVGAIETETGSATGWADAVTDAIKKGFDSDDNPFFDAAKCSLWDGNGPVPNIPSGARGILPLLNTNGKVPTAMLDIRAQQTATSSSQGIVRVWDGTGSLPDDLDDNDVVPTINEFGGVSPELLPTPSTSQAGIVREATDTEITNRTPVVAFVPPSKIGNGVPDGYFVRKSSTDLDIGTSTLLGMTNEVRDARQEFSLSTGEVQVPTGKWWVEFGGLFQDYGTLAIQATASGQTPISSETFAVNIQTNAAATITAKAEGFFNLNETRMIRPVATEGVGGFKLLGVNNVVTAWLKIWRL